MNVKRYVEKIFMRAIPIIEEEGKEEDRGFSAIRGKVIEHKGKMKRREKLSLEFARKQINTKKSR